MPPHAQGPVHFSKRRDGSPERGENLGSSPLVEGAGEGGVSTDQLQASSPVVTYTRSPPPTEPRYVAGSTKAALVSSAAVGPFLMSFTQTLGDGGEPL